AGQYGVLQAAVRRNHASVEDDEVVGGGFAAGCASILRDILDFDEPPRLDPTELLASAQVGEDDRVRTSDHRALRLRERLPHGREEGIRAHLRVEVEALV